MKKILKKAMASMMLLAMCISLTQSVAYAEETKDIESIVTNGVQNGWDGVTNASSYEAENYTVVFTLLSYWEGGYNATVEIANTGDNVIENWCVEFDLSQNITNIWNAKIVGNENNYYVIKNADWNQDIPIGGSVSFGLSVNENFNGFPAAYNLLGESIQVKREAYSVGYALDSDRGNDFTGKILITNNTEQVIEDWTLEFEFDREIINIWNGEVESWDGRHYVIHNMGYNANIVTGETVSIGFNGVGGTKENEPYGYSLFSYSCVDNEKGKGDDVEEGIKNGISWDEMTDTDSDGLPDVYENENGLDPENPDTDGDGLLDGFEVMKASSNPLDKYTLGNGIIDAELDPDEDGLTLVEEQMNGTNPLDADTDGDGIIDGEEVHKYKTNPIIFDTDNDGLGDGVEIEIGLDPLNPQTFGYPDKEYRYAIKIDSSSDKLSKINKGNGDYVMDLTIEGEGDISADVLVRNSAYSYSLKSDFSLGVMPEIIYKGEGTIESVTVSFQISDKNIYDKFSSEDLRGVKRYSIFYLDEENNILTPLSTDVDEENNVISAVSSKIGTFIVVDMEKWFSSLGYEIVNEYDDSLAEEDNIEENVEVDSSVPLFNSEGMLFDYSTVTDEGNEDTAVDINESKVKTLIPASANSKKEDCKTIMNGEFDREVRIFSFGKAVTSDSANSIPDTIEPGITPVDLVFCINNSVYDISDTESESLKQNILVIGKTIFQNCRLPRIYILNQNGSIVQSKYGSNYTTYEDGLVYMLETVKNTPPQVQNFGKQLETLVNDVHFRTDSYRAIVFFGDPYLPSNSEELSQAVADMGARCIINCPYTQTGSWYDDLSEKTNGILLYSYLDFSDDIIEFMFGEALIKEPTTYNMISSMGLKKIVLKGQLNSHSLIDTDEDSLSDWAEIRTDRITVNSGGGVILPTYYEYLTQYSAIEFMKWKKQYRNLYDRNGKTLDDMLNEVLVLPVLSDPTMKDSDGDGILDNIERTYKVTDERYECLGAFHTDTIETIYPELSDSDINNPSYPSYITVNGNDVVVHLKIVFKGDTDVKANSALNTVVTNANVVNEVRNITSRLGSNPTLKELVIDGIENRWSSSFIGNEYDFCEGLPVNFSVEVTEDQAAWFKKEIQITIRSGVCGVCNQSGVKWSTGSTRKITIYTSYCGDDSHEGRYGALCSNFAGNLYHMAQFEGTVAHEIGHSMGLDDLYASANHDYTIVSNSEIVYSSSDFALPSAGTIMMYNGRGTENDIEMVILAFSENKWQHYVPYGKKQKISKAIKSPVTFENTNNPGVKYQWDEASHSFQEE